MSKAYQLIDKLKRTLEWLLSSIFDSVALFSAKRVDAKKEIAAVVHLELLGDALMWLPYGQALVRHLHDEGKDVILIVDARYASFLADSFLDCQVFAIPRKAFLQNMQMRWSRLRALRALGVTESYHPSHPRDGILMDAVVRAVGAPASGFDAVAEDRPWLDGVLSRRLYSTLVKTPEHVHQNDRQLEFLRVVGASDESLRVANLPNLPASTINGNYWILAPGANQAYRRWPAESFGLIAVRIAQLKPDLICVLVGTEEERPLAQSIRSELGEGGYLDLMGRTNLPQLFALIAEAKFLLGNDSGAGHIAAAVGTPSVVVTGGGHWGRCFPYPPEAPIRKHPLAVGFPMPCYGCDWQCAHTSRKDKPYPCIEGITVEAVMQAVEGVLAESA